MLDASAGFFLLCVLLISAVGVNEASSGRCAAQKYLRLTVYMHIKYNQSFKEHTCPGSYNKKCVSRRGGWHGPMWDTTEQENEAWVRSNKMVHKPQQARNGEAGAGVGISIVWVAYFLEEIPSCANKMTHVQDPKKLAPPPMHPPCQPMKLSLENMGFQVRLSHHHKKCICSFCAPKKEN